MRRELRPVARAIVRKHALEACAQGPVAPERPQQRPAGADAALVRLDGTERHARGHRWPDGRTLTMPSELT